MGWYRASHFSCERISTRVAPGRRPLWKMRSSNGGWHGLAGWGFRGFPETGAGLWADDGANSVSDAGSSLALTNLRLAELRSVSEFPGAQGFSLVLAAEARRAAVLRHRCALQADQACRTARRRRRVQVALIEHRSRSVGSLSLSPPHGPQIVLTVLPQRKGRTSMAKQKSTSRAAARTAAQKKSPARSIASKTAAKSTARKTIKAKDRKTKARGLPVAKRARPK